MRAMLPGTRYWNFSNALSQVKFLLQYSTQIHELAQGQNLPVITTPEPAMGTVNSSNSTRAVHEQKWSISLSNGLGIEDVPCQAARHGLNDAYSTLNLVASAASALPQRRRNILGGQWTGTCNPRVPARAFDCNVDLNVDALSGAFDLIISGCGGFDMTNFAAGTMHEQSEDALVWRDPVNGRMSYKDVLVNYAHGVPYKTTRGWVGRASVFWDESVDSSGFMGIDWFPKKMTLNMWRPGEGQQFPSQRVAYPDEQRDVPCQVLHLKRIPARSRQNAIGSMKSEKLDQALRLRFTYQDLYLQFKVLLTAAEEVSCPQGLASFFNSSTSILAQPLTISSSDCHSRCFSSMNHSLSALTTEAGPLWRQFLDLKPPDKAAAAGLDGVEPQDWEENKRQYAEIYKFFAARVVYVADFLARGSLACTGNYKQRTCLQYANSLVSSACRNSLGSPRRVTDLVSLSVDPFNRLETNDKCFLLCLRDVEDMLVNGHCCTATFEAVQLKWASFVLQGYETISLDLKTYQCLYAQMEVLEAQAHQDPRAGEDRCWHASTETEMAEVTRPAQSTLDEACKSDQVAPAGGQSLECVFDICGSYSVPDECCLEIEVRVSCASVLIRVSVP